MRKAGNVCRGLAGNFSGVILSNFTQGVVLSKYTQIFQTQTYLGGQI